MQKKSMYPCCACHRYAKIHALALANHGEKCTKKGLTKPDAASLPMTDLPWLDILDDAVSDAKLAIMPRSRAALARYMHDWAATDPLLRQVVGGTELNKANLQHVSHLGSWLTDYAFIALDRPSTRRCQCWHQLSRCCSPR